MTLSELSRRTGTPLTTTHRLVSDLVALGMLERDHDGVLSIGVELWRIGLLAPRTQGVQRIALPFMQDVYATTGMPVHLGVPEGSEVLFVESLRQTKALDAEEKPQIGARYLMHETAVGLAILAHEPRETQEAYIARVSDGGHEIAKGLRRDLAQVRSVGHAVSTWRSAPSVSIGAPILDDYDQPLGAVSIIISGEQQRAPYGHLITATARSIQRIAREQGVLRETSSGYRNPLSE